MPGSASLKLIQLLTHPKVLQCHAGRLLEPWVIPSQGIGVEEQSLGMQGGGAAVNLGWPLQNPDQNSADLWHPLPHSGSKSSSWARVHPVHPEPTVHTGCQILKQMSRKTGRHLPPTSSIHSDSSCPSHDHSPVTSTRKQNWH